VKKFASLIDDNFEMENEVFSIALCGEQARVWTRVETSWKLCRNCGVFVAFTEEESPRTILGNGDSRSANAKAYYNGPYLQGILSNMCKWQHKWRPAELRGRVCVVAWILVQKLRNALMLILPLNVGFILVEEAETFILRVKKSIF
jgi:hypothetical protein